MFEGTKDAMPDFQYVCLRHRQMFIAAVIHEGGRDPAQMERVRQQMFVWVSERLPLIVLDAFNAKACLGCAIEAAHLGIAEMYDALRDVVRANASTGHPEISAAAPGSVTPSKD